MSILRVESVIYGVEDIAEGRKFLTDWGLEEIDSGENGAIFRTLENQHMVVRKIDDAALPPALESGSTAREVIWGVDNQPSLDALAAELSTDREITVDENGTLHTVDDSGFHLAFQVADITPADVPEAVYNFHENIERVNQDNWPEVNARPMPLRIGHVVFSIEAAGNWEAAKFYLDRLGFRVTDRAVDAGTFMQCDGSNFHHCLLLYHRGDHRRWNHMAFEVANFDALMGSGTWINGAGYKTTSGPGRHSLGSNWFWYFECPLGGEIEYFADMDRMDENWEPRTWDEAPPYARWMLGDGLIST